MRLTIGISSSRRPSDDWWWLRGKWENEATVTFRFPMSMLLEIATRSKSKKYPVNLNPRTSQAWEDVFGTKLRARWTPVHLRECMRGDEARWYFGKVWNITRGIIAKYHYKSCYYLYLSTRLIKPNFCFHLSHRRSTTGSLKTRNPWIKCTDFRWFIYRGPQGTFCKLKSCCK